MKLKYLGTAAAEGVPALFCECDTCKFARGHGGREIRTRAQALIDGRLLLDFGPDTLAHANACGLDLTHIETCLITHVHSDHFYPEDLQMRRPGFAILGDNCPALNLFGPAVIGRLLAEEKYSACLQKNRVIFHPVAQFESFEAEGYTVTPLPAIHGSEGPLIYMITDGKSTLLYAHDTDVLERETLDRLAAMKVRFDLVSMDCTAGKEHIEYRGHMNLERNAILHGRLLALGLADENTVFVENHFSHNGHLSYAEATELARRDGFKVSYDGMEIEF